MDNYFRQSFFNLDPVSCHSLADHMEAHARVLRRHADTLKASQTQALRRQMKIKKAAKLVNAKVKNGDQERSAIYGTALSLQLPFTVIEANYEQLKEKEQKKGILNRRLKVKRLRLDGFSLRSIAKQFDISHTAVRNIIK